MKLDELDTTTGANPLNGYATAIQAAVDVATGKSRSRLRLDAAQMLFDNCALPPWVDFGLELDDDEA